MHLFQVFILLNLFNFNTIIVKYHKKYATFMVLTMYVCARANVIEREKERVRRNETYTTSPLLTNLQVTNVILFFNWNPLKSSTVRKKLSVT